MGTVAVGIRRKMGLFRTAACVADVLGNSQPSLRDWS
jgi:hypothetical protein